jgi:dolichol kinase
MIQQAGYAVLLLLGFSLIILMAELLHHYFFVDQEYTRKLVHSVTAFASLIFLLGIFSFWLILFLAFFFSTLLLIGKRKNYFRSIDSPHGKTIGSIVFPFSIALVYFLADHFNDPLLFILPVLILAICDPLAWLAGTYFKNRTKRIVLFDYLLEKTFMGSAIFFLSAFFVSVVTLMLSGLGFTSVLFLSLIISMMDTLTELISPKGTDNFTVPLITSVILIIAN